MTRHQQPDKSIDIIMNAAAKLERLADATTYVADSRNIRDARIQLLGAAMCIACGQEFRRYIVDDLMAAHRNGGAT
jgi:hypothetical protein